MFIEKVDSYNMKINIKRKLLVFLTFILLLCGCFAGKSSVIASGAGDGRLEVHYLDIGQGDATLIVSDGHAMLIDAGENDKGTFIQSYLKAQGIKQLDYVIGTHPDSDHIGGLDVILYKFDCKNVLLSNYRKDTKTYMDVLDTLKAKGYKATVPDVGDTYKLGDASFTVLSEADAEFDDANNSSVAIRLEHGENQFLFVGDAEEEAENSMMESGQDTSADVYKVSHHGSRNGTSEEFLEAVNPEYAVISCGEGNSYGHPHAEVLNLLRREGVKVFRTDEQGAIVAVSDGSKIAWNMLPSESWIAGEPKGTAGNVKSGSGIKNEKKGTYILNTGTKKIHKPSCNSVGQMSPKNKKETNLPLEELKKKGYAPCGACL